MKDLERKLVIIMLFLVGAIFTLLLFNSCRTKKQAVNVATTSTIEQQTNTATETTDKSTKDEDFTEIVYVLDSAQVIDVFGNSEQPLLKVSQIKIKNSHVTSENKIDNKIYATEEKTAEIKEKTHTIEKEKPVTGRKYFFVGIAFAFVIICLFLWWFYKRI